MNNKILITGTTSGIGEYISKELVSTDYIIGAGRKENPGATHEYYCGDLKEKLFIEYLTEMVGELDFLVVNAGVGYFDEFENLSEVEHREIIETNLLSPILLISALLKKKKIKKGVIFIGSSAGKKSTKYGASYSASKFGLRGFAMSLKNELKGLKVNIINPNIIDTGFHKNSRIEIVGKHKETSLEDILETIKNLISGDETRFEIDL